MRSLFRLVFLFIWVAGLLFVTPLEAGSVFLKNGYIIQGRVIESDPLHQLLRGPI